MIQPKSHNKARVKAYLRLLEEKGAPDTVKSDFLEIVRIDDEISAEGRGYVDPLEELFFIACQKNGFAGAFDKGERRAFFRPATDQTKSHFGMDTGWGAELGSGPIKSLALGAIG